MSVGVVPLISIHGVLNSTPALETDPGVDLDLQIVTGCPLTALFQSITKEQCKPCVSCCPQTVAVHCCLSLCSFIISSKVFDEIF